MSEFRWDPLRNSWVIVINSRLRQPHEFIVERQRVEMLSCPFCPGQEAKTPHEVYATRPSNRLDDAADWQVRVVPNKFPILRIEGELSSTQHGLNRTLPGIGAHEVIIETSDHARSLSDLATDEITEVLKAYRARLLDLRRDRRFRYLQIFKAHGSEAGAPVPHSHSQLIAVPIIPPLVQTQIDAARDHCAQHGSCLLCAMIAQETDENRRVIFDNGDFVALAPYASRFPFETRLLPRDHTHDFARQDDTALHTCAAALKRLLRMMTQLLEDPPYNFILHTAPTDDPDDPMSGASLAQSYHWHIELVPRLNRIAGFEWGSGFYMNPMPPEGAARYLREVEADLAPAD